MTTRKFYPEKSSAAVPSIEDEPFADIWAEQQEALKKDKDKSPKLPKKLVKHPENKT